MIQTFRFSLYYKKNWIGIICPETVDLLMSMKVVLTSGASFTKIDFGLGQTNSQISDV